jgi:16S rRNA (uracil1498-N3)-methyltransferase
MSERFYVNCPLQPGPVVVEGSEAHHLATVCRLHAGDQVCLFNGDGRQYPAVVLAADKRSVELEVQGVEAPARELPMQLEVAVPLPRGDRAQFLVEKLTELGVGRLVPLSTARSVLGTREVKREKLQRWVIEASKQCGRNVLMEIAGAVDWKDYCRRDDLPRLRWIAHPGIAGDMASLAAEAECPEPLAVAVGPEGGFTEEEVESARTYGWKPVSLGPRILRVETAALLIAGWASLTISSAAS